MKIIIFILLLPIFGCAQINSNLKWYNLESKTKLITSKLIGTTDDGYFIYSTIANKGETNDFKLKVFNLKNELIYTRIEKQGRKVYKGLQPYLVEKINNNTYIFFTKYHNNKLCIYSLKIDFKSPNNHSFIKVTEFSNNTTGMLIDVYGLHLKNNLKLIHKSSDGNRIIILKPSSLSFDFSNKSKIDNEINLEFYNDELSLVNEKNIKINLEENKFSINKIKFDHNDNIVLLAKINLNYKQVKKLTNLFKYVVITEKKNMLKIIDIEGQNNNELQYDINNADFIINNKNEIILAGLYNSVQAKSIESKGYFIINIDNNRNFAFKKYHNLDSETLISYRNDKFIDKEGHVKNLHRNFKMFYNFHNKKLYLISSPVQKHKFENAYQSNSQGIIASHNIYHSYYSVNYPFLNGEIIKSHINIYCIDSSGNLLNTNTIKRNVEYKKQENSYGVIRNYSDFDLKFNKNGDLNLSYMNELTKQYCMDKNLKFKKGYGIRNAIFSENLKMISNEIIYSYSKTNESSLNFMYSLIETKSESTFFIGNSNRIFFLFDI